MPALLTVENAAFSYGEKIAVEALDFSVMEADYLCVVGENGSGKSTLLNGILGLRQPLNGRIEYSPDLKKTQIGYLPQQNYIQSTFPASSLEVVLSGRLGHKGPVPFYSRSDRSLAREALALVGAEELETQWFGGLSGGQRQRVLLARALSTAPDGMSLLILDEPMSGLDPHVRTALYEVIERLNQEQGISIIMVTHDVNTALHFAKHIILLASRQIFFGSAEEFEHSELGSEYMRDACADHCAVCGYSHLEDGFADA